MQKSPNNQKFSELLLISPHGIHHEKKDWESEKQNKKVKKNIKVTHSKLKICSYDKSNLAQILSIVWQSSDCPL